MTKKTIPSQPNVVDDMSWELAPEEAITPVDAGRLTKPELELRLRPNAAGFDLEGLMTDFPTAKELERFVYDQTGIVLNLKGRANKLKYTVALDVLNGVEVDPAFVGVENPYIERIDMVPEDPVLSLRPE